MTLVSYNTLKTVWVNFGTKEYGQEVEVLEQLRGELDATTAMSGSEGLRVTYRWRPSALEMSCNADLDVVWVGAEYGSYIVHGKAD
jgi:hypothetical protein